MLRAVERVRTEGGQREAVESEVEDVVQHLRRNSRNPHLDTEPTGAGSSPARPNEEEVVRCPPARARG